MIKSKEKEFFYGLMEENMMDFGLMDFSMELDYFMIKMEVLEKVNGLMGKELSGLRKVLAIIMVVVVVLEAV
jgi:hypothetical protein